MQAPPLLIDRAPAAQAGAAIAGPVLLGALCGWLLGVDETAYTILSLLAVIGGIGSGFEHGRPGEGAVRGVSGGAIFGAAIIATSAITGAAPEAHLPEPPVTLVAFTALLGALFGAIGGALRRRREPTPR